MKNHQIYVRSRLAFKKYDLTSSTTGIGCTFARAPKTMNSCSEDIGALAVEVVTLNNLHEGHEAKGAHVQRC